MPGPVEHTLLNLGIARQDLPRRGPGIDQASAGLIAGAAAHRAGCPGTGSTAMLPARNPASARS